MKGLQKTRAYLDRQRKNNRALFYTPRFYDIGPLRRLARNKSHRRQVDSYYVRTQAQFKPVHKRTQFEAVHKYLDDELGLPLSSTKNHVPNPAGLVSASLPKLTKSVWPRTENGGRASYYSCGGASPPNCVLATLATKQETKCGLIEPYTHLKLKIMHVVGDPLKCNVYIVSFLSFARFSKLRSLAWTGNHFFLGPEAEKRWARLWTLMITKNQKGFLQYQVINLVVLCFRVAQDILFRCKSNSENKTVILKVMQL